jgi:hypothetical protein
MTVFSFNGIISTVCFFPFYSFSSNDIFFTNRLEV